MARLVSTSWVAERLGQRGFLIIDPRRPMKYLSGHLPGAVNLPAYKAFGADGALCHLTSRHIDRLGRSRRRHSARNL